MVTYVLPIGTEFQSEKMGLIVFDAITFLFLGVAAGLYLYYRKVFFAFLIISALLLRILHVNTFRGVNNVMKYPFWAVSLMCTYLSLATSYSSFKVPKNPPLASAIVMIACTLPLFVLILLDYVNKRYQAKQISLLVAIVYVGVGFPMILFCAFFVAIFIFTPLFDIEVNGVKLNDMVKV